LHVRPHFMNGLLTAWQPKIRKHEARVYLGISSFLQGLRLNAGRQADQSGPRQD
jgi:hypothetical protein